MTLSPAFCRSAMQPEFPFLFVVTCSVNCSICKYCIWAFCADGEGSTFISQLHNLPPEYVVPNQQNFSSRSTFSRDDVNNAIIGSIVRFVLCLFKFVPSIKCYCSLKKFEGSRLCIKDCYVV